MQAIEAAQFLEESGIVVSASGAPVDYESLGTVLVVTESEEGSGDAPRGRLVAPSRTPISPRDSYLRNLGIRFDAGVAAHRRADGQDYPPQLQRRGGTEGARATVIGVRGTV